MKKTGFLILIAFTVVCNCLNAQIPSNGLVGYWPFSGNANDMSGNNNHGTVNGATITNGVCSISNSAYDFNGTNNFIEVANSTSLRFLTGQQTISFWIKIASIPNPTNMVEVFEKMDQNLDIDLTGNSAMGFYIVFGPSGDLIYSIKDSANSPWGGVIIPHAILDTNNYMHVVFVNDGTTLKSFLNGIVVDTSAIPIGASIGLNSNPLLFGKGLWTSLGNPMDLLNGQLDNIRIYDTAINDTEVLSLYHEFIPVQPQATDTSICGAAFVTVKAIGGSNYNWYNDSIGGLPIDTGSIYSTPFLYSSTNYYVSSFYGTCESTRDTSSVDIFTVPTVILNPLSEICLNDTAQLLSGGNPVGGTYSGTGVSGGYFNPATAGAGIHNIYYNFIDSNSCANADTSSIMVHGLPSVSISGLDSLYCINAYPVVVNTFPVGGSLTGTGIVGNTFNPDIAGDGIFDIIYYYSDSNGCNNADTVVVTVDLCSGILNEAFVEGVSIFPNPTSGHFTIKLDKSQNTKITIFNIGGDIITNFSGVEINDIDISNLPDGIFFIKISGENLSKTIKIIKCAD